MQKPLAETERATSGKMECFEAIRGLAALAVVIGHLILTFCPALYFRTGPRWDEIPRWLQFIARFPGKFLWNGELPVEIFFVLSGFVLSLTFFQKGSAASLSSAAIRRFPRLMAPVAASVLLAFLLLQSGLMFSQEAARRMDAMQGLTADPAAPNDISNNWLRIYYGFAPSITDALREGTWGAFFGPAFYNPVLWTMPIELAGSFLVYGFLALFGGVRRRWLLYAIGGILLWKCDQAYLADFLGGIALCDLWAFNQRTWQRELPLLAALAVVAVALFAVPWKPASALLVVAAAAASPRFQRILSVGWLSWLGRVSFALYLIHMPIFCSLSCGLYLVCCRDLGWSHVNGALTASAAGLAATLFGSWLFCRLIDRPAILLSRWIDEALFRRRPNVSPVEQAALPVSRAA
jgi:peptidoglycan/LPS O-acetylase OafA/YrhL